jgi:hypothetical protein
VFDLTFTVIDTRSAATPLTLAVDQAVLAGWTGRDPHARDKHIAELEAIGIARQRRRRSIIASPRGG